MALTAKQKKDLATKKAIQKTFPDYEAGNFLANKFFAPGSMGRVNAEQDPATQDIINRYKGIADQYMTNPRSAEMQDYLSRYKSSLNGYTSAENQGMLEQANRGVIKDYQSGIQELAKSQAKNNVRGAFAGAQNAMLQSNLARTQAANRQDIFIRNADEKQRRLEGYGGALSAAERDEYDRRNQTTENYRTALYDNKADLLNRAKYNNEQTAAENAGRAQSFIQTQTIGQAERSRLDNRALQERAISALNRRRNQQTTTAPTTTTPAK